MSFLAAATVYLLYLMGAVPFAVWAGRTAHASALARAAACGPARPGRAVTIFLVVLPLVLITSWWWNSLGAHALVGAPAPGKPGDWQQIGFLALSPCAGLIAGYGIGWMLARRG